MRTWKNQKTALTAGILAAAVACCGTGALAFAAGAAKTGDTAPQATAVSASVAQPSTSTVSTKDETVYIMTNADGSAKKVIVSDLLTNPQQAATLKDVSDLKDITYVGGDQTYTTGSPRADRVWPTAGPTVRSGSVASTRARSGEARSAAPKAADKSRTGPKGR